jgi:hypothetical protein
MSPKPTFYAPRDMLARKPAHGAACTHCGLCCVATLCGLAQHVFHRPATPGPCPALTLRNGVSACGLVEQTTGEMRAAALHLIGAGDNCDARFNGEPRNMAYAARQETYWNRPDVAQTTRDARRKWGMT